MAQETIASNEHIEQNPPPNRIRIDKNDVEGEAGAIGMISIIDLNVDCLEKIFSFLNVNDLLNVVDSNKLLKQGAEFAFKEKKNTKIILDRLKKREIVHYHDWSPGGDALCITDLNTSLQLLRCFGHLIFSLEIVYTDISANNRVHLDHYIADYCAATLTEISITKWDDKNTGKPIFKDLDIFFPNVQIVSLATNEKFNKLLPINKWFPKMISLHVNSKLKHLGAAIRMNPQLQHLSIDGNWNTKMLKRISKLPVLETLSLNWSNFFGAKKFKINTEIQFKNVKKCELYFRNHMQIALMPLKFDDQLVDLTLPNLEAPHSLDFICKHPTINKLTLCLTRPGQFEFRINELFQLKNALPSLTELSLHGHILFDEAYMIINVLTSLKIFYVRFYIVDGNGSFFIINPNIHKTELDEFMTCLCNEWQFIIGEQYIKLERRIDSI